MIDSAESARTRSHMALAVAVFVWFAEIGFVVPFLALYVKQLEDLTYGEVALWTGVVLAGTPFVSAVATPLWGSIADRMGRKWVLQRSIIGFSLALGLTGLVTSAWQLLAVRLVMGLFGGFIVLALSIVSLTSPPGRVKEGIGLIQAARVLGMAAGPLVGGLMADWVGIRTSFFVGAGFGAIALALVDFFVVDARVATGVTAQAPSSKHPVRAIFAAPCFVGLLVTLFMLRMSERTFDPTLPLLVEQLGAPGSLGVATTTGIIACAGLSIGSVSAMMIGRLTRERPLYGSLLLCVGACAAAFVPLAFVQNWWQLLIMRALVGLALGAATTLGFSAGAEITTVERRGLGLGLLASGSVYGATLGSLVGGGIGALSIQMTFIVNAGLLMLAGVLAAIAFGRAGMLASVPALAGWLKRPPS